MTDRLVLKEDLVIPAGTELDPAPTRTERSGEHYQASIALTQDNTAFFTVYAGDPAGDKFEKVIARSG